MKSVLLLLAFAIVHINGIKVTEAIPEEDETRLNNSKDDKTKTQSVSLERHHTNKVDSTICPACHCHCPNPYYSPTQNPLIQKCGVNERYYECKSWCSEKCDNHRDRCVQEEGCSRGCRCIDGFVRINSRCVPESECPGKCGHNEVYTSCVKKCRERCPNEDCREDTNCYPGCECERGFVRINQRCVPESDCRQQCPLNEVYTPCVKKCREKCSNEDCEDDNRNCYPGCECERGFVRINQRCVPESECRQKCPLNEVYRPCVQRCDEKCLVEQGICVEEKHCRAGCECEKGFVRIDSHCVPESRCPAPCPRNEIYVPCVRKCNERCQLDQASCINTRECSAGCTCAPGTARIGLKCVPLSQCPTSEFDLNLKIKTVFMNVKNFILFFRGVLWIK